MGVRNEDVPDSYWYGVVSRWHRAMITDAVGLHFIQDDDFEQAFKIIGDTAHIRANLNPNVLHWTILRAALSYRFPQFWTPVSAGLRLATKDGVTLD